MNRPATRGKGKRPRPEDEFDWRSEILRKIHLTAEVTDDDVEQLYNIRKTTCQGCRVNNRENPNCFCGLIPLSNGSRKTGLWQKISEIVSSFGPDPSKDLRSSYDSPAGLTNLGATCYANSTLQFLYMNMAFRAGIFSIEPDVLKQQPVLDQLARLFAQLHGSKMSFVDSAPFIKTLELDNGVQQDSHEFLTLLLSLLERCLSQSKVPKSKTIVQDLFRGSMSHVTRCSKCGQDSEASMNLEDFYELELNVKGMKTLDESLKDYLSVEALDGANQYYCSSCDTRVNATHCIKLRSLSPVLNFQLKRYVFHQKTTTKKKITSAFSFPQELDMGQRLAQPSESQLIYDLSAVLLHKGTAANSGHYVAHIKDERTGQWWEFDDEHVSNLGYHPFGEGSSTSASKPDKEPAVTKSCTDSTTAISNENHVDMQELLTSNGETYSSSDAYLLMYNLRRTAEHHDESMVCNGNNKITEGVQGGTIPLDVCTSLPSHLSEPIEEFNASYLDACRKYDLRKEVELKIVTERRDEVRSVLSEAPVLSFEEPYFWISTDWLRQWADNITPPALDNSTIQCSHGKVPVSKVGFMKRLSAIAWERLYSKYNGGPSLSNNDCCTDCLLETAREAVSANSFRDKRATMKELAEAALGGKCFDGVSYYVSKSWLQQWVRRRNSDNLSDSGPTASIRCSHGQLMPEQAAGAKRVLIPENLWLFFYENSNLVKPNDFIGCSTFPSDSATCSQCCEELSEVAYLKDSMRAVKLQQRQNHEKLALGKSVSLFPNCKYYLLPSTWLSKWRNFVSSIGKTASSSLQPEPLNEIIDSLKCEKHSHLLERPLNLVCKRGMIFQKTSAADGLTIISENDWKFFCEEWGGNQEEGVIAEISLACSEEKNHYGSCQGLAITEDQMNDEVNNQLESTQPFIKTFPEICEECIGERESCKLMEKLNYSNEDICVCLVRGKEAPKSLLKASMNGLEPDRRTSKRSRKTSFGNSTNLKVSGSTSVYQLKMMIWEYFEVVKENQILHKGSSVIDDETATLADLNVFPGDVLWVTDSEIHEYRDIADEFSEPKVHVQEVEEGFRGTLLTSTASSQVF